MFEILEETDIVPENISEFIFEKDSISGLQFLSHFSYLIFHSLHERLTSVEKVIVPMSYEMGNASLWESDDFLENRKHIGTIRLIKGII